MKGKNLFSYTGLFDGIEIPAGEQKIVFDAGGLREAVERLGKRPDLNTVLEDFAGEMRTELAWQRRQLPEELFLRLKKDLDFAQEFDVSEPA